MNSIWQNTYICKYMYVQNVNVSKFTSNISNWLFDIVNHKLKPTQLLLFAFKNYETKNISTFSYGHNFVQILVSDLFYSPIWYHFTTIARYKKKSKEIDWKFCHEIIQYSYLIILLKNYCEFGQTYLVNKILMYTYSLIANVHIRIIMSPQETN